MATRRARQHRTFLRGLLLLRARAAEIRHRREPACSTGNHPRQLGRQPHRALDERRRAAPAARLRAGVEPAARVPHQQTTGFHALGRHLAEVVDFAASDGRQTTLAAGRRCGWLEGGARGARPLGNLGHAGAVAMGRHGVVPCSRESHRGAGEAGGETVDGDHRRCRRHLGEWPRRGQHLRTRTAPVRPARQTTEGRRQRRREQRARFLGQRRFVWAGRGSSAGVGRWHARAPRGLGIPGRAARSLAAACALGDAQRRQCAVQRHDRPAGQVRVARHRLVPGRSQWRPRRREKLRSAAARIDGGLAPPVRRAAALAGGAACQLECIGHVAGR